MPINSLFSGRDQWQAKRQSAIALLLFVAALAGYGQSAAPPSPPPPLPVTISQPIARSIVEWDVYTGRTAPMERVACYLQARHRAPGW
jgi:hypothetical protein